MHRTRARVAGLVGALILVTSVALAQPADPLVSSYARRLSKHVQEAGPFESQSEIANWVSSKQSSPLTSGEYHNPLTDPTRQHIYQMVVGRDSSLWIQTPTGKTIEMDAYISWRMGVEAAETVGFDSLFIEGVSYGWDEGRMNITAKTSVRAHSVIALLAILLGGLMISFARLRITLHKAEARGVHLADSRRRFADNREAERLRLARELHDGPLQDLQAIRMRLGIAQLAERRNTTSEASTPSDLGVQDDVLRVISEIRDISEGLRPPVLGSFGLAAAVRTLAERHRPAHPDVRILLEFEDDGTDLAPGVRLALYRIIQESLNNALKHARASRITVEYARKASGGLRLAITDDGIGFSRAPDLVVLETEGHLGLAGMSERAQSIGGELRVVSRERQTSIEVVVEQFATSALSLS